MSLTHSLILDLIYIALCTCVYVCVCVCAVRVIDMSSGVNLSDVCLQETGGLGVDCIIDDGSKS